MDSLGTFIKPQKADLLFQRARSIVHRTTGVTGPTSVAGPALLGAVPQSARRRLHVWTVTRSAAQISAKKRRTIQSGRA